MMTLPPTHNPATDLGYPLYKKPPKLRTFELPFGNSCVYPEATI
jgi:hypothetical protein